MIVAVRDKTATRIENLEREMMLLMYGMYGTEWFDEFLERMQEEAEARRVAQMHEIFDLLESKKHISLEEFLGKSDKEEENPFLQ